MRLLAIPLAALALIVQPDGAWADTIRLKNGNRFEGKVKQQAADHVIIEIPGMGKMRFESAEIASVKVDEPQPAPASQPAAPAEPSAELPAEEDADENDADDRQAPSMRECDSRAVEGISVVLAGEDGLYSARVAFKNKKRQPCATRGVLTVSREVTEYKKDFKQECVTCFTEEVQIPVEKHESIRSVNFKPSDFEKSDEGDPYLYVDFRSGQVQSGDILVFQWRSFQARKSVQ